MNDRSPDKEWNKSPEKLYEDVSETQDPADYINPLFLKGMNYKLF